MWNLLATLIVAIPLLVHIVYCFTEQTYVLLLVGVIAFPVGWFHGIGVVLGFW